MDESALEKFLTMAGIEGLTQGFNSAEKNSKWNKYKKLPYHNPEFAKATKPISVGAGAGLGAVKGGASQMIGSGLYDSDGSFGDEFARGAVGGGVYGAGEGFTRMGNSKLGNHLVKFMRGKTGMSKGQAIASLLGGATAGSAASGGLIQGLQSAILFGE